nr:disease resistance protein RPM1-like [Ipomoea batatas]
MAEAAVTFVLEQLPVLIRDEYSLLGGIRDDAEEVMNAFHRFSAVLRVADEREEIDPQVRAWVKIIRELVYDTEDVLDEFQFRFGGGGRIAGGFFSKIQSIYASAKNLRARRRLALQLRRVKAKLNKISQEQPRLLTPSDPTIHNSNTRVYDGRRDALLLKDSDLVGIDNPKLFLVNLLLAVDEDLRVHSVVGMGGLGKTTLVKKVFDDALVVNHFQLRVWLTVSETFKVDELLKDAIGQIIKQTNQQLPQDIAAMNTDKLKEFINDILSGQSYIVVLDDIWDINDWRAIKYSFPRLSFGSRIVITTRNSEIGFYASNETHGNVHSLQPLSHKDSWILFCKKTFSDGSCPPHLLHVGVREWCVSHQEVAQEIHSKKNEPHHCCWLGLDYVNLLAAQSYHFWEVSVCFCHYLYPDLWKFLELQDDHCSLFCDCAIHKNKLVLAGQRHRHCSSPGVLNVTSVAAGSLVALPVIGFPDAAGFLVFPRIGFPVPAGFPVELSIGVDLLLIGGQAAIEGDEKAPKLNALIPCYGAIVEVKGKMKVILKVFIDC